ncbi:MAG: MaoC/PaaZ C-terminal domain-containing protein [Pseudomonadota bacterium]
MTVGLFFEQWKVGDSYTTAGRTVTETDVVVFAGLSGDYNLLHTNEEYCKTTPFGTRVAHGPLVYAIAAGLLFQLHLYDDTLIAFLGFENLRFTKPVKIGDTLHAKVTVLETTASSSKPDRGVMKRQLQVINQRGEVVQEGVQAFLLKKQG